MGVKMGQNYLINVGCLPVSLKFGVVVDCVAICQAARGLHRVGDGP